MLDHISIFTQTGLVLWSRTLCKIKGDPVNELIKTVLIEERGGDKTANFDRYTLKWTLANDLNIVFVVVYQKILQIFYVEELLQQLKQEFLLHFEEALKEGVIHGYDFDKHFDRVLKEVEKSAMLQKKNSLSGIRRTDRSLKNMNSSSNRIGKISSESDQNGNTSHDNPDDSDNDETEDEEVEDQDDEEAFRQQALTRLQSRRARSQKKTSSNTTKVQKLEKEFASSGKRGPKKPTIWHDGTSKKLSAKAQAALDHSKDKSKGGEIREDQLEEMKQTYLPEEGESAQWEESDEEEPDDWLSIGKSKIGNFFQSLTGNKILNNEDLDPIIDSMRENLMTKNVAAEISEEICNSVRNNLEGQRLASFTRIKTMVQSALKQAIVQVLTPKKPTDILREILAAKQKGKPYSLVFVGVNGVGKSTSLAKVCYYLKEHGISVMMAACDTFRSGAVEQLGVHAQCLGIPLFEKGYARDPAGVAGAAIKHAEENGIDCVCIDTAGRMQNNVPLMRALSKLITDNEPDLVLFVGEALVGNDGIDQLTMFNQAILNYSPPGKRHQIDGIVLTKFDTIDTKVGAALSMTYKTGQPVVFVGTGQKYTHLRKLNVNMVIKALFS
mmetsp:Transcript_20570/g.27105  ORF Transcript_20570/g.27105 Transcript_20570/m.27105 type:complete len:611 (+) Transcript_20570:252-2084(+)|eukprot:CAMPEP_0117733850 /NCGR_PEP_ID=MMETSP0947-20121206/313_1 /TAXON_ID=44440 /ORGANISM="Chattonella subsalsa, Strain CCMP2191" /LENGTH=610 /DNA_ID=CAMNT_0005548495 /DNA_START=172 /DNA_END=2004 /DNA_ORIENTATION=-